MPDNTDPLAMRAWRRSTEGKKWLASQRTYRVTVDANGAFRIDDLPAGTYSLDVIISVPDATQPTQSHSGRVTRQFSIQEPVAGRSDTVFVLGEILVQIGNQQ